MWDYPARTLCVMGCWAIIGENLSNVSAEWDALVLTWLHLPDPAALHPHLLVPLPPFMLSLLLLQTYQARYPVPSDDPSEAVKPKDVLEHALQNPTSTGHGKVQPPMTPEPPHEGSIKYYENLRDIQNM